MQPLPPAAALISTISDENSSNRTSHHPLQVQYSCVVAAIRGGGVSKRCWGDALKDKLQELTWLAHHIIVWNEIQQNFYQFEIVKLKNSLSFSTCCTTSGFCGCHCGELRWRNWIACHAGGMEFEFLTLGGLTDWLTDFPLMLFVNGYW